jgi:hypothetical protein
MKISKKLFAGLIATSTALATASLPAYASGPAMASKFAVLSDGATDIGTTKIGGVAGDVGGFTTQLTDKARVNGNAIATSGSSGALDLGDNARVNAMCVTGGGSVAIDNPKKPGKCLGGIDISGTSPFLTEHAAALVDLGVLIGALSALTPTQPVADIDIASKTKVTMTFGSGVNVFLVSGMFGRFLVESSSTLTIQAPAGASVVFLVAQNFTLQSKAKIVLKGGIKANSVAYVVAGDTIFGVSSSFAGTVLSAGGTCMADAKAKITGALLCEDAVTFGGGVKMTFAPLTGTFP